VKDGPVFRDHAALKVTAGLTRAFAVLVAVISLVIAVGTGTSSRGVLPVVMPTYGFWPAAVVWLVGFFYAAVIWAGADVFIMLADGDDAHRRTHHELQQLRRELASFARPTGEAERESVSPPPIENPWGVPDAPKAPPSRPPSI
jgi:hypothetical protein